MVISGCCCDSTKIGLEIIVRQVYSPTDEGIGYEAGSGPDTRTMLIMGVTLAAFAGAAHQAFQAAPAPVFDAPDGPIKVRVDAPESESAFAASLIYQPLRGEALSEDVRLRSGPERLIAPIPLDVSETIDEEAFWDGAALSAPASLGPSHRVQFGAVLSESAAKALWLAVLERSPDVLADAELEIGRVVDKQGRNLFTVQTGPIMDRAEANRLCARLRSAGESCMATYR